MIAATSEELAAAGIDAAHPFAGSERRTGEPGRWRIADHLVTRRSSDGGIVVSYGYFTPFQVHCRKLWSDKIAAAAKG